ncbi:trypsin-like peptidase domain-containing protein [Vibrio coralliilyticus]|nr:trypsin-like peptidase domain-containing protein [Vibrio coralliilyticus]
MSKADVSFTGNISLSEILMRKYFVQLLVATMTGCANGIPDIKSEIEDEIEASNEKIFVGLPVFASLEGTTVRLDESWLLTAKHNRAILTLQGAEVHYHPYCDIALVRNHGLPQTKVGLVYSGDDVSHIGYPIGLPISSSKGLYIGDIFVDGWDKCQKSASTGVVMAGMSGGGVYNKDGELVGINHGYTNGIITWSNNHVEERPAIFVSLYTVKDWLQSITGKDYFDATDS